MKCYNAVVQLEYYCIVTAQSGKSLCDFAHGQRAPGAVLAFPYAKSILPTASCCCYGIIASCDGTSGGLSRLHCFCADEELTLGEIQERMHVPEEDVIRLAHSLSCAKYKILNKSPASKTVSKTDIFSMNKKFTDRMRRIRVSAHALRQMY